MRSAGRRGISNGNKAGVISCHHRSPIRAISVFPFLAVASTILVLYSLHQSTYELSVVLDPDKRVMLEEAGSVVESSTTEQGFSTNRSLNESAVEEITPISSATSGEFSIGPDYQSHTILEQGCAVTVVLMDPDLGQSAMWTLESVAEYVLPTDRVCILLQTSICPAATKKLPERAIAAIRSHSRFNNSRARFQWDTRFIDTISLPTTTPASVLYQREAMRIKDAAQAHFLKFIQRGQVRMTVLDYKKYHLTSCRNFYNPSFAWENYRYWGSDEFSKEDSDLVLIVQDDAVLCRTLDMDKWSDVAWVGAPWVAREGPQPWHYCTSMPRNWYSFHKSLSENNATKSAGSSVEPHFKETANQTSFPAYPTPEQMCTNTQFGPQGNGGLSIRRRSWLRRAIMYCPTSIWEHSGLTRREFDNAVCHADEIVAEDSYFVTVLRGIGAPLPSSVEAALFAWESQSIDQILLQNRFGIGNLLKEIPHNKENTTKIAADGHEANFDALMTLVDHRWSPNDAVTFSVQNERKVISLHDEKAIVVPIGVHKPWGEFFRSEWMCHKEVHQQCKYLSKIIQYNKYGQRELERQQLSIEQCLEGNSTRRTDRR